MRSSGVACFTDLQVVMLYAYFIQNTAYVENRTSLCSPGLGFSEMRQLEEVGQGNATQSLFWARLSQFV